MTKNVTLRVDCCDACEHTILQIGSLFKFVQCGHLFCGHCYQTRAFGDDRPEVCPICAKKKTRRKK
jgi:hypothetical protein